MESSGLLLIDKERDITSRKVDNLIGKRFNTHKVGHLGTLDPFATGLLVVAVNRGTKFLPYLKDEEKTYKATLNLGKKTSTGDNTAEVIEEKNIPSLTKEEVEAALRSLLGKSKQIPPMTSAKKINGVALYKQAHKGIEVERKPVEIEVYDVELNEFDGVNITFTVTVSKGTYIRTLGEELAERLNTVGHLTALRRTKVGDLKVENASTIEEAKFINPLDLLSHFEKIEVEENKIQWVKDGRPLMVNSDSEKILVTYLNEPLAIYKHKEGNQFVSERGLF